MNRAPGHKPGRRESAPGSPTPAHATPQPASTGQNDPEAARTLPTQTVTGDTESQEHETETELYDSTSSSEDASSRSQSPTPQEPQYESDIQTFMADWMDVDGEDIAQCFQGAPIEPPVTVDSLAELDLPRIINNPKLRHDVNFDRELHFRPNFEGHRGQRKVKSADSYWKALVGELFVYAVALKAQREEEDPQQYAYWVAIIDKAQCRLPKMFDAVKDILKTLVPEYEQESINLRFDVDLIMQEIIHGQCDLVSLSEWIAAVLKAHCAPMRDEIVDDMKRTIQSGAWENSHEKLTDGLRQLVGILEQMKLDVANHQIRHMRPLLVDDTIHFQRKYNAYRMRQGKINVAGARNWLYEEIDFMTAYHPDGEPTHLTALVVLFLKDTILKGSDCWPSTFYLDTERLRVLRQELHARVYQEVCWEIFSTLVAEQASQLQQFGFPNVQYTLHCRINAIVGANGQFYAHCQAIAAEMVRLLLMATGHPAPHFDHDLIKQVEQRLEQDLRLVDGAEIFKKHASLQYTRVLPKVQASVEAHLSLSLLDLQDALVPAPPSSRTPPRGQGAILKPAAPLRTFDPDMDLVRKLTHVIVLHWHVWGEMVYMAMPEAGETTLGYPTAWMAPPDTVPQARAVYAPGRQWLPISVTVVDEPAEASHADPNWWLPQNDTTQDTSEEQ